MLVFYRALYPVNRRNLCLAGQGKKGGGGTPLQEAIGDVSLDGVANFRLFGVSRVSKWKESRLKRSERCLFVHFWMILLKD